MQSAYSTVQVDWAERVLQKFFFDFKKGRLFGGIFSVDFFLFIINTWIF